MMLMNDSRPPLSASSIHHVFPPGVGVECRRIEDNTEKSFSCERQAVNGAVARRRDEFATGRVCPGSARAFWYRLTANSSGPLPRTSVSAWNGGLDQPQHVTSAWIGAGEVTSSNVSKP